MGNATSSLKKEDNAGEDFSYVKFSEVFVKKDP